MEAAAIALATRFKPDAVTLDIMLPDMDGWTVLDRLKHDPKTRHIPVNVISADSQKQRGFRLGAIGYLEKPVTKEAINEAMNAIKQFIERPAKNLLIVEDDEVQRNSIIELIGNGDVESTAVASGAEAIELLKERHFDCMVIDLGLPDMTGYELIKRIQDELGLTHLPIVVYTGKDLTSKEELELRKMTEAVIVKEAKSPDRLLDETALFLHRVEKNLPEGKRKMLEQAHNRDPILSGRKILVVDDDVRNIFALTVHPRRAEHAGDVRGKWSGCNCKIERASRHRSGADGCDDARDRWLRDDQTHQRNGGVRKSADYRADCKGDEGRPRKMHRVWLVRLHRQAS